MNKAIKKDAQLHHRNQKSTEAQSQSSDFIELREALVKFKNRLTIGKNLTPEGRKRLTTVGRERRLFTHQSLLSTLEHDRLMPDDVTAEQIQEWIEVETIVLTVFGELEALKRSVYDFYYELTHKEYQTALIIYRRSKTASREGVKGMQALYDSLRKAYINSGRRDKDATESQTMVD